MNKAFVRESDAPPPRCPAPEGCGGPGIAVSADVLAAHVPEAMREQFSSPAYYCAAPGCSVAYFDAWGATAPIDSLEAVPYPKDPQGPVCSCLGITARELAEDARRGDRTRVKEILAHARGPEASCARLAPDGNSCERVVRRVFLEYLSPPPQA